MGDNDLIVNNNNNNSKNKNRNVSFIFVTFLGVIYLFVKLKVTHFLNNRMAKESY